MKFLVVGGSGFIGRHFLAYVQSLGYDAMGTQLNAKSPGLINFDLLTDRIEGVLSPEYFQDGEPIVAVIAGGIVPFDQCFQEKELSRLVNVDNTIRLIEDLNNLGARSVFLSSEAVYDGVSGYFNEEMPRQPICEYGHQKADVERFTEDEVPGSLVLRLDYVVGDDPKEDQLFTRWHKWIEGGQTVDCIEGQLFAPTFVDDVAHGIVLACEMGLTGVYNLAGPEFFTREELARQFVLAMGSEATVVAKPVEEFEFLDRRPLRSYLDSTKFVRATEMRFTSMREVMRSFIRNAEEAELASYPSAIPRT